MATQKKATKAQVAQRVAEIVRWQAMGATLQDIYKQARSKRDPDTGQIVDSWGADLSASQIRRYVTKANAYWLDYTAQEGHEAIGKSLGRLDLLYQRSVAINDFKTALSVQREINEIMGLRKLRVEMDATIATMSDAELEAEIERLELEAAGQVDDPHHRRQVAQVAQVAQIAAPENR